MTPEERKALFNFETQLKKLRRMDDLFIGVKNLDASQRDYLAQHKLKILKEIQAIEIYPIKQKPIPVPAPIVEPITKPQAVKRKKTSSRKSVLYRTTLDLSDDHFDEENPVIDEILYGADE